MKVKGESMSGKRSLLDYFKKAEGPPKKPDEVVEVELVESPATEEEIEEVEVVGKEDQVQEVEEEQVEKVNGDHQAQEVEEDKVQKVKEDQVDKSEEVSEEVVAVEEIETNGRRRSTRASANRAREAWNEPISSSEDEEEDDDLPRSARKRKTRSSIQNSSKRSKQTTLSANGKIIKEKDKENKAKKKPKYDPEREAFLRSGVPDVIEKIKKRPKSSVITLDDDDEEDDEKPEKERRKPLDPATLAFLHSGLPESIKKAQQTVEKRKEENEFLVNMGFFPKISHTSSLKEDIDASPSLSETNGKIEIACKFNIKSLSQSQPDVDLALEVPEECLDFSFTSSSQPASGFTCLSSQESDLFHPLGLCCDDNSVRVSSQQEERKTRKGAEKEEKEKDFRPWIETTKVNNVKDLLVDMTGLETLTKWLKQWRSDIKDDGGTSRKLEKKKKRGNSSDSDFITSDEGDSEMKKKSVLLTGPSGSGKTTAVYVLADHYQFKVVEVNFSSRRSGKEVLQRVEEAVLSHRVTSSLNCLLLFKDIDLFHPEEDEGFYSAVAQLITTAVRPIVMTSSLPEYYAIDPKLDRKDPLRIAFNFRKPRDIVERILKPILAATKSNVESDSMADVDMWLDSIVRHSGCDVRHCINQLQLLLSTHSTGSLKPRLISNQDIHLYSSPFLPHSVDLNFPRQNLSSESECNSVDNASSQEEDEINLSLSARKKLCHSQLEKLSQNLEIFADLDWISRTPSSISTLNTNMFGDIDEANWRWKHGSSFRAPFFTRLSLVSGDSKRKDKDVKWAKKLVLESDTEIDKWMEIDGLNSDIGQYCGSDVSSAEWESYAAVRTIVKNNKMDSAIGRVQKRHGRMASYFNRLEKLLVDRISNTFDFKSQLDSIKVYPDFD